MFFGSLEDAGRVCSAEDILWVASVIQEIEDENIGVSSHQYITLDGEMAEGFYYLYLKLSMYMATPSVFYKIIKIDQSIGWINMAQVEKMVFAFKAISIIEDEKVKRKPFYIHKNNVTFRIGQNGAISKTLHFWDAQVWYI